ncbi:MAG: CrcB family protein [Gammaproteobacteria bacterium]|nr:CrcB family protein [Gammaproteobacteria bacterium]
MNVTALQLALVALGGALGSLLRFLASGAMHRLVPGLLFPIGTLTVNVVGSLLIGLGGGLAESRDFLGPHLRVFLFTGCLGGFTTFSAFAFESLGLALDAAWWRLLANVTAQLVLGLGAAVAGYALGRAL